MNAKAVLRGSLLGTAFQTASSLGMRVPLNLQSGQQPIVPLYKFRFEFLRDEFNLIRWL